jgi:hypothetical protein
MRSNGIGIKAVLACAAACLLATTLTAPARAAADKPVAGQQARFPDGTWSALPQVGPDGKVRQCVLVAMRQRSGPGSPIDTRFTFVISRGSGFAVIIADDGLPAEWVLDDRAQLLIDNLSFPSDAFTMGARVAFHPGNAAGALDALAKAKDITLRSDGVGVDSGPIKLHLPGEALTWLKQCGQTFDIPVDHPTDPNAPPMPEPRPPVTKVLFPAPTPAGPPGIDDKQKIDGWDASELRDRDGHVAVCFIRRHYVTGSEPGSREIGTFLMVSRMKGLTLMLKDSTLNNPEGQPVDATFTIEGKPFTAFSASVLGNDEIGVYPNHGKELAALFENGGRFEFKTKQVGLEFPVQTGVIGWLRACARRSDIAIEPPQAGQ